MKNKTIVVYQESSKLVLAEMVGMETPSQVKVLKGCKVAVLEVPIFTTDKKTGLKYLVNYHSVSEVKQYGA